MKTGVSTENEVWAKRCLNMSRIYTALSIVGLIVLFMFIVAGLVSSPALFWRTGTPTLTFTIVEHCFYLGMIIAYLFVAVAVMFAAPDFRQHNYAFLHGSLIGYSYPFSLFMLGESTAWWTVPSPTWSGVSVLSAIMGGIVFCGSYVFWILFSQPSARKIVSTDWKKRLHLFEIGVISLWHLFILAACASMLWIVDDVRSQQGFTLIINVVAYLSVLGYTCLVRYGNLKTHLALGSLFGAALALLFMSGKWTFNFASHYLGAPIGGQSALYISAFCFNTGMAFCILILLGIWPSLEVKSDGGKGREGEAYV